MGDKQNENEIKESHSGKRRILEQGVRWGIKNDG